MKKMCNLILVDASASMQPRISDVKGGLMKLFSDIKENSNFYHHTIVCDFSDDFNVLINSTSTEDLKSDVIDKYSVRSSTSLLDAIGKAFELVPSGYDGVYVNIITDGEENSSKQFTSDKIKSLISSCREKRWGITFMGCDEKAIEMAKNIGITNTFAFANNSLGYESATKSRSMSFDLYLCSVENATTTADIKIDNLFNEVSTTA